MSDSPTIIPRNPAQIPASQFRITRNLKVRGDAIFLIFGGIVAAVILFVVLLDISLIPAIAFSWMPLSGSVWFYFRFIREKPQYYFDYWLNSLFGDSLSVSLRKTLCLKARTK